MVVYLCFGDLCGVVCWLLVCFVVLVLFGWGVYGLVVLCLL